MPGQNPVVAEHYQDQFQTISFPLHGSTITRGAITPLLYVEKRQIVIDDVRLITRNGEASLTIDVGFMPGATPTGATWTGTYTCSVAASTTVTIVSTVSGSLSVGDRLVDQDSGAVLSNIPADAYIASFGTYPISATNLTGTVIINTAATGTSTGASGEATSFKSVLTAPMSAATDNTIVVGAINSNLTTIPTAAPNSLEVTEANNVVPGPVTVGTTTTLGNVIGIEARGAATTNYVGTLQIRYRERLA
jgi:hypothetical protein